MLEFMPPDNIKKIDRAIKALRVIIPKDSDKDRKIHQDVLNKLLNKGDLD
ncbi:hypothetical protein [Clostridium sp.]|jgi:hypothetical protein